MFSPIDEPVCSKERFWLENPSENPWVTEVEQSSWNKQGCVGTELEKERKLKEEEEDEGKDGFREGAGMVVVEGLFIKGISASISSPLKGSD